MNSRNLNISQLSHKVMLEEHNNINLTKAIVSLVVESNTTQVQPLVPLQMLFAYSIYGNHRSSDYNNINNYRVLISSRQITTMNTVVKASSVVVENNSSILRWLSLNLTKLQFKRYSHLWVALRPKQVALARLAELSGTAKSGSRKLMKPIVLPQDSRP